LSRAITRHASTADSVNIRPGVSILSVLRHLNYKPWFAIAEFVDNSLQSFVEYRDELLRVEGPDFRLQVCVEPDPSDGGRIVIRDNAAGIHEADYHRAFRPAEIPPNTSGLSEFGMGMKSAACWFAREWTVRTTALGEAVERTVAFDIDHIVRDDLEELEVRTRPAPVDAHYTEIMLSGLHKPPQGRTIGKIKDHLASIYRVFIREGVLDLRFDREILSYPSPSILVAPYFKEPTGEPQRWYKEIDLDFGLGVRARGFAALREKGSVSGAGFALFRRDRLIEGSGDEAYRPEMIFGKSNSFTYQRLFGELQLDGFEVSHTKDGFRWEEHEEIFLDLLKDAVGSEPLPLLSQAEGYRTRVKPEEVRSGAEIAAQRTAETIEREAPQVIERQLQENQEPSDPVRALPPATVATKRVIDVQLDSGLWRIDLELSADPALAEWVSVSDQPARDAGAGAGGIRHLGIRLALAHPFTERFGGTDPAQIEPLLRIATAIVLAEVTAREGGVKFAGVIRRHINELLRDALSKP